MKKAIIIRIDSKKYEIYKEIIAANGLNMSMRIRNFIDSEIKLYKNEGSK